MPPNFRSASASFCFRVLSGMLLLAPALLLVNLLMPQAPSPAATASTVTPTMPKTIPTAVATAASTATRTSCQLLLLLLLGEEVGAGIQMRSGVLWESLLLFLLCTQSPPEHFRQGYESQITC
jgi:hypothetical protein